MKARKQNVMRWIPPASWMLALSLWIAAGASEGVRLRLDEDRIWLEVQDAPLSQVLNHFYAAGISVQVDPAVEKRVSGRWEDEHIEPVLNELFTPYSHVLEWRREPGPLGALTRLTAIRIFREGHAGRVRPLESRRRVQTSPDGSMRFMARELLIGFAPGATLDDLHAFLSRTGGTVIAAHNELGIYRILLPEGANILEIARQIENDSSIALAEPNLVVDQPGLLPGPSARQGAAVWRAPHTGGDLAVAVLDTGVLADETLQSALQNTFDALNPQNALLHDPSGHGTLMARLASGLVDPHRGPSEGSVPVVAVRAFEADGMTDSFTLMNAITHAVEQTAGPLSLSWGSETPSRFLAVAIDYALERDRLVFAAVGNENSGRPVYPAALPGVIGVAAADGNELAAYSNRGDFVDLVAPGAADGAQGTSIATAYAAHLATRYQQAHPDARPAEVLDALRGAANADGILTEESVRKLFASD